MSSTSESLSPLRFLESNAPQSARHGNWDGLESTAKLPIQAIVKLYTRKCSKVEFVEINTLNSHRSGNHVSTIDFDTLIHIEANNCRQQMTLRVQNTHWNSWPWFKAEVLVWSWLTWGRVHYDLFSFYVFSVILQLWEVILVMKTMWLIDDPQNGTEW